MPLHRSSFFSSAACLVLLVGACAENTSGEPIPTVELTRIEPSVARGIEAALHKLRDARDDAEAWKRLGLLYEANDFLQLAARCYRSAADLDPSAELLYRLGIVLSAAGEREEAVEAMVQCIELAGHYAPAHWRLGSYRFDLNEFAAAERSFRLALELDPKHLGGWTGLARIQLLRGEGEQAIETLNGALKLKPSAPLVRKLLRSAYFEVGRIEEARALQVPWERIGMMGGDPWQREIRSLRVRPPMELALEHLQKRNYKGVVEVMEPFVEANPRDPNAYAYLASGYNGLGRVGLAKETLDAALAQDVDSIVALRVLASIHQGSNEIEEALGVLKRILAIDRLDLDAWRWKGDLEVRLGRNADAVASWREVVRFDERDEQLLSRIEHLAADLESQSDG